MPLDGRAVWVPMTVHPDERGTLSVLALAELDFVVVRVYTVDAPDGAVRGGHGHRHGRQILMCMAGAVEVELRAGGDIEHVTLAGRAPGLLINPGVWSRQTYRGAGASLLVLCDTHFDPADYSNDAS